MNKFEYVYHASTVSGLKEIIPNVSTHKNAWVYATNSLAVSAMFLGDNFDFICQIGIGENGLPYIFERFEGALKLAYESKSGSIYKLKGESFEAGKTSWSAELVSEKSVSVIQEIFIEDSLVFLNILQKKGEVEIYKFP